MNIELKKKFLHFQKYKLRCTVGKSGISSQKKEGDNKTPRGEFDIKYILYRKDRVSIIKTTLNKKIITKKMVWCDDKRSNKYNKLITFPFKYHAEKLWLKNNTYDIIVVINYNLKPVIKNKGSAIFLHIAKKNIKQQKGVLQLIKKI